MIVTMDERIVNLEDQLYQAAGEESDEEEEEKRTFNNKGSVEKGNKRTFSGTQPSTNNTTSDITHARKSKRKRT